MNRKNVHVFSDNHLLQERIEAIAREENADVKVLDDWHQWLDHSVPSLAVIDQEKGQEIEDIRLPKSSFVIVLIHERSFDEVRKWMAIGANQVLVIPEEMDKLERILAERLALLDANQPNRVDSLNHQPGKVSAFYSTKGGSGKTLMATIAAQALQIQHDRRVIMIDLNAQFGGIEVITAVEPSRSYQDLQPVIEELSPNHIQNVSQVDPDSGVHILPGPADPEQAASVPDVLISRLIQACRFHFDHVILDMPCALNTISFAGLNEAAHIFYLLLPDSLSLRGYKQARQLFQRFQLTKQKNVSIVLNRKHKKAELTEKSIAKLIDEPIAGSIRADFFALQPLLNMGKPFFNKKGKPLCKAAQDVALLVDKTMR